MHEGATGSVFRALPRYCLSLLYISHVGTRCSTIFCFLFSVRNSVAACTHYWSYAPHLLISRKYDDYYDTSAG
jgi:hypothetical protein